MYPWPVGNFDYVMDDALYIAMDYLRRTGQVESFAQVDRAVATAIVRAWRNGERHRIKLANAAITAVEREADNVVRSETPRHRIYGGSKH